MDLQINVQMIAKQQALLTLAGDMNAVTAPALKAQLKELAAQSRTRVVVDMGAVGFIDSSGLAALVSGLKAVRSVGGSLKLAAVRDQPREAFKLTMLERVFEFYPSAQAALGVAEQDE
jgi:anti-sigma B factor antagonist